MYTNGYTGTYTLELPKHFESGLSFIIYPIAGKQTAHRTLYDTNSGYSNIYTELILNNASNIFNYSYEQHSIACLAADGTSTMVTGSKNSLLENKINILTIFNNDDILETNFNGNLSQTSDETMALDFSRFNVNADPSYILLAVAVTKSKNITYPLNKNSDVLAYVDFSDPNNPTINGDTSYISIASKSIHTVTPQLSDESVIDKIKITDNTLYGNASMQWVENLLVNNEGVLNGDISTVGNTLDLLLTEINVKITVKSTSTTSCSLTYYPIDGNTINPIDIRRCTIWGGSGVETYTLDNGSLTSSGTVVDDTVYTQSNDTSIHFIRVNSIIYVVTVWISAGGARTSLIYRKII